MKRNRAMTAKKIEVVKTTAEDFVFFFPPSLQEPRTLPNRKLKAEGDMDVRANTSCSFWVAKKQARRSARAPFPNTCAGFIGDTVMLPNTINTRRVVRGSVSNCTSQPYNLGAVEAFSETHKLPRLTQGETGGDHQKQSGKRRN